MYQNLKRESPFDIFQAIFQKQTMLRWQESLDEHFRNPHWSVIHTTLMIYFSDLLPTFDNPNQLYSDSSSVKVAEKRPCSADKHGQRQPLIFIGALMLERVATLWRGCPGGGGIANMMEMNHAWDFSVKRHSLSTYSAATSLSFVSDTACGPCSFSSWSKIVVFCAGQV